MEISDISRKSNQIYLDILKGGASIVRKLFSKGDNFSEQMRFDEVEEYIKKMLLSQMNISSMIFTHKYQNAGPDGVPQFRKELAELETIIENSTCLKLDDELLDTLFGNSLGIRSEEELEEWISITYYTGKSGVSFDEIFRTEIFMRQHETERNPFKKFFGSFKYNKMKNNLLLEDTYTKKVREMMQKEFQKDPDHELIAYQNCREILTSGIGEYQSLQAIEDISRMVLQSLMHQKSEPINISQECEVLRSEFQKDSSMTKVKDGYRQRKIILGKENYEQVPFEQVGEAIAGLQQRYEEAFHKEQSPEDYVKDLAKIVADFVYLQPFEDGNKRTAISLFNSMMISKGLIPPPISIINDDRIGHAFEDAKRKNYEPIQDIFVDRYEKNLRGDSQDSEKSVEKTTEKNEIDFIEA